MSPRRARLALATVSVFVLLHAPTLAQACAVCSSGRDDETRDAFIWTAVLLSVMPLLLITGLALWLRGKVKDMQREDDEVRLKRAAHAVLRPASTSR